jgi:hypothetical protein
MKETLKRLSKNAKIKKFEDPELMSNGPKEVEDMMAHHPRHQEIPRKFTIYLMGQP